MRLTLATKFVVFTFSIAALGLVSGLMSLVITRSVANSLHSAVIENFPSLKAADELEIALMDQMRTLSAYLVSQGDPAWQGQSRKAEAEFATWLSRARASASTAEHTNILDRLEKAYAEYDAKRKKLFIQFDQGRLGEAPSTLLHEVGPAYDQAFTLCEQFIDATDSHVLESAKRAELHIALATKCVLVGSLGSAGMACLLLWLVVQGVLLPLRRMAAEARAVMGRAEEATKPVDDELRSIGIYFRALMEDVAESRKTLAESRNRLLSAEKLASIGKLAASVAHEMRNPLSSMKMWLYSIRKTAGADPSLDRKYQILSEEINRLESIVRNVLEFSRPPVLKRRPCSIAQLIDKTLEIQQPWLETKKIHVVQHRATGLPDVMADADQLRQVFVNLMDNAAEAMPEGGEISISTAAEVDANGLPAVVVRVQDTGHGIPEEIRSRLFEPFFTTKEQGTGLGLCIAANIMAQHDGQLAVDSSTAGGTTFAIRVPSAGMKDDGHDSRG